MRILTMNLFCHHGDWEARRPVLVDGLRRLAPDVMTFQEVVVTDGHDQVRDLLGPDAHVLHQAGRTADGVGASIVSRWPMELVLEADLHVPEGGDPAGWIGSLTVVRVDTPTATGPVLVAHHKPTWGSPDERVRELQAVMAVRLLEEACQGRDEPVVLAGDLDAGPDAASIRFLTGKQSLDGTSVYYQDAWEACHASAPGHTFTPANPLVADEWRPRPGRRIDHIMVRCGTAGAPLDIVSCDLAFDAPVDGVFASDHYGVVADLRGRAGLG